MCLTTVQLCIFDEADRLFELGFADQLRLILARLSSQRQTLLFSATLPAGTPSAAPAQAGPLGLFRVRTLPRQELRPTATSSKMMNCSSEASHRSWLPLVALHRARAQCCSSTTHRLGPAMPCLLTSLMH